MNKERSRDDSRKHKRRETMNIDELTIGQLNQLQGMIGGGASKPLPTVEQKRAVVVVDRGWIFAGDLSITSDGYLRLDNAVHVFGWQSIGFAAMLKDWKSSKVDLRAIDPVEVPLDAVIFRVPVASDWGKK
jgi:hypothetical protein